MASSHGYNITSDVVNVVLQITWEVASIKIRDPLPNLPEHQEAIPSFSLLSVVLKDKMSAYCLVRSLLARGSYGGMTGDIIMMQRYASIWLARFQFPSMVIKCILYSIGTNSIVESYSINWRYWYFYMGRIYYIFIQ